MDDADAWVLETGKMYFGLRKFMDELQEAYPWGEAPPPLPELWFDTKGGARRE